MINTDEKIEKGLNPVFDEGDLQALCAYDAFLDKHHEEISAKLREGLKDDPVLGPIINSQTEEERQEQEEISRRLQKAAIQEGEWEQYTNLLRAQAIGYAKAGLGFSDWVRVVMLYRDYALEFIKTKSHESIETILEIVDGQNKLIDYALNVIGSSFIDELREKYERKSQQLELALSVGKIGVWDWDMKENHIVWDETMYKLYDLKKSEFKNKYEDFEKRVHPDDREKVSDAVTRSIENREDFTSEFRVIHRDGSLHYLTGRGKIIYKDDGSPIRMTGTNLDITQIVEKQIEIDNIKNAIYKSNLVVELMPDGIITYVNDEFLKLINYASEELIGQHHSVLVTKTMKESKEYREFWEMLSNGEYQEGEYPRITKDQHTIWIKGNYNPILNTNGEVYRILKLATDITVIKEAEGRLLKFNEELEKQVSVRTKELRESNKELEDFSYTVSHDLRAPIRAINGFSTVLDRKLDGRLDEQEQHYLSAILDNVSQMGHLIDDLLEFSRVGRIENRYVDYDMNLLVEQVFKAQTQTQGMEKISFNLNPLPNVFSDREMIKIVWNNLIENAIKYSRDKGKITISISGEELLGKIIYKVEDNGVGFEMEYVHKVFGIFQRLHDKEEVEGTGVGLAIVHRIVQRHGGEVWAESKLGKGSTFYFSIPKQHSYDR